MNMNLMTSRGLPDIEITPEVIVKEVEKARRLHDEFIVTYVSQGLHRVSRSIGAFSRRGRGVLRQLTFRSAQRPSEHAASPH